MGKNLNVNLNKPSKKVECQDPEHVGDRRIGNGDLWMEWPDFIIRCDACYKRGKKVETIPERPDDDTAQE